MVSRDQTAPDFNVPVVEDEIRDFTLSERLPDEAPLILAFFPGPFTEGCTNEMTTFRDQQEAFEELDATIYGVHTDTPASLQAFREEYSLNFGLLSDTAKEVIEAYDVRRTFEEFSLFGVPDRAVFVIDSNEEISYKWVADDPRNEPDYEAIREATHAAT